MTIDEFNQMPHETAQAALTRCCGATRWVDGMMVLRPFADPGALHAGADAVWATMQPADVLEAFSHHPQIGADLENLRKKFAATATWSAGEQSGVSAADEATLLAMADGNRQYLEKFGYIFIVCATGKSASEMLTLLRLRLPNDPDSELAIAAAEQGKIIHIRLTNLLEVQSNA